MEINPKTETIPLCTAIIGTAGSGKKTLLIDYISRSPGIYNSIVILSLSTPMNYMYQRLSEVLKESITCQRRISDLPPLNEYHKTYELEPQDRSLLVIDDLNDEMDNDKFREYIVKAKKYNISIMILSHTYNKIPYFIRDSIKYIYLLKIPSKETLRFIVKTCELQASIDDIYDMYLDATHDKPNFFKIDMLTHTEDKRFSKNYTGFYEIRKLQIAS